MIVVLVEGNGDKRSLPPLLQGQSDEPVQCIDMKGKSNIVRHPRGFEDTVRRQWALGRRLFIVLVDGDVTSAPYNTIDQERSDLFRRAERLAQELQITVQVCWAVLEMESWLIGGIQSRSTYCGLREVGRIPANTEIFPPDPKRWLQDHLRSTYGPHIQECLSQHIDLNAASRCNQSLQDFLATVRQVTS